MSPRQPSETIDAVVGWFKSGGYETSKLAIEFVALIVLCFGSWHAWQTLEVVRLEPLPWISYSQYDWQVERDGEWVGAERLREGERFRVQLLISNTGETPGINARYVDDGSGKPIGPEVIPPSRLPLADEPPERIPSFSSMIMPDAERPLTQIIGPFEGLTGTDFDEFKEENKILFFRARIEYCDVLSRFRWTEIAIRRFYGRPSTRFQVENQIAGPIPGIAGDRRCSSQEELGRDETGR